MKTKQELLAQPVISVCNPDFPTPDLIEFVGKLGFDAVFLDCMNVQEDLEAVTRFMQLGMRWVNVHLRNFMARGAREFLAGVRR